VEATGSTILSSGQVLKLSTEIETLAEHSLGVIRDGKSLESAEQNFRKIYQRFASSPKLNDLSHLAMLGELMAGAALRREESRGLHFRTDHVERKNSWLKWLLVTKNQNNVMPIWTTSDQLAPID
jgi:aspartate oxidase